MLMRTHPALAEWVTINDLKTYRNRFIKEEKIIELMKKSEIKFKCSYRLDNLTPTDFNNHLEEAFKPDSS